MNSFMFLLEFLFKIYDFCYFFYFSSIPLALVKGVYIIKIEGGYILDLFLPFLQNGPVSACVADSWLVQCGQSAPAPVS